MTNEEKFKTPDKRYLEMMTFCGKRECKYCPLGQVEHQCGKDSMTAICAFLWLTLEDDIMPSACPCCGSRVVKLVEIDDLFLVSCRTCGLQTVKYFSASAAIKAWNRRAK